VWATNCSEQIATHLPNANFPLPTPHQSREGQISPFSFRSEKAGSIIELLGPGRKESDVCELIEDQGAWPDQATGIFAGFKDLKGGKG
jgi:hypothetical protein